MYIVTDRVSRLVAALGRAGRRFLRLTRPTELACVLLLVSGGALFRPLGLPWAEARWVLLIHVVLSVLLVPLVIVPFWLHHRSRLRWSRRPRQRITGRGIELGLVLLFGSGGWLLFWGWNGTNLGWSVHMVHLLFSVPILALIVWHGWRNSLFRKILVLGALSGALALVTGIRSPAAPRPGSSAAIESRSLMLEPGNKTLLVANFEGGSVSRIEAETGKRLAEGETGGNITAVARDADDGLVAAADFNSGNLHLLHLTDLGARAVVNLPAQRLGGVLWDPRNRVFWVTAPEDDRLFAVTPSGKVAQTIEIAESPRGLALLQDGRLLVSHSMIGAVSIYDTTSLPPRREKLIELAVEQNPDETVSQGLPRGLNRIVVSPDGKQAWLPHVLWNFDHPFQFQSTVFPAISVLSLVKGQEHEAVSRRKQLFRQINIIENGNRTRIVSNPADVAFNAQGTRAYVTMAGSEDLALFDLSRALPIDSKKPSAKTTQGARAAQIYRHLPGQMPEGIVLSGDEIYIQNRMGLDITRGNTGGTGPFAQLRITDAHFATTVGHDPLSPQVRRGTRLFFNGNTASFPEVPMAGDNWMSCSSCHVEGFNFTNRALFKATPIDKFHSTFTGHGSIRSLVAGDFVGDYIRMVRNTQGGMGADTRFDMPRIDPDHPTPGVRAMMEDLHAFVISRGNLPLLATWLRGPDGGADVDPTAWTNAAICAGCHQQITRQWANSLHNDSARTDPYYIVLEDEAARNVGEGFRAWCRGCHAPQGALSGITRSVARQQPLFADGGRYRQAGLAVALADLAENAHSVQQGVGCLTCHRVSKVEESGGSAGGNASLDLDPASRPLYPFETSDSAILRAVADRLIRARPEEHKVSMMRNLGGDASNRVCAACHEEFAPGTGAYIVETYQEWLDSPYNAPDDPARNRTCVDCHMHASVETIGQDVPGRSTDGGPVKANVATHDFTGGQYHLAGLRDPEAAARSIALLRSAAELSARIEPGKGLELRVSNTGAGHALPTGVSDFRQLWLELTVTDATGKRVLGSGRPDASGVLDPDARVFHKVFDGTSGHTVGLDFWRQAKFASDTRIPAGGHRDEVFALPPGTAYPVTVDARLMFRTFPQAVTDLVRKRFPAMPSPEPVEIAHLRQTFSQPQPLAQTMTRP